MVELEVRKFGKSLGFVLPKEVIARLNTQDGAPLYLTEAAEGGYRLVPYDPDFEKKMGLDERNVLAWHDRLLVLRGGVVGVRDVGLLKSVLVRPQQHVVYGDAPDTVHLAAIYDGARGSRGY